MQPFLPASTLHYILYLDRKLAHRDCSNTAAPHRFSIIFEKNLFFVPTMPDPFHYQDKDPVLLASICSPYPPPVPSCPLLSPPAGQRPHRHPTEPESPTQPPKRCSNKKGIALLLLKNLSIYAYSVLDYEQSLDAI
jgi:hypothetical protein